MAGLFDTLGTASRSLQVVQRGIATTGHNIANVDTPGYARQRNVLQTGIPLTEASGTIGTGVELVTVERIVDEFTQTRLMDETNRRAALEMSYNAHSDVESIFNDQLVGGLGDQLGSFFDSLDELAIAAEPGQPVERSLVLSAGQGLVDTIHSYDDQLRDLQQGADRAVAGVIPEINQLARSIAELNAEIVSTGVISTPNDLLDRRDQLILELSEKVDITTLDQSGGALSVRMNGGVPLVDGGSAYELVAVVDPANLNPFDSTFSQVYYQGGGNFFDATAMISGGELGGHLEARDSVIGGAIRDLDAFAFTLSESFNTVHRAGRGLVDDTPHDFFADLSGQTTVDDAARNFAISADIDPSQGGSLDHIAAGGAPGPALMGDTTHVEQLKDLRTSNVSSYLAGDLVGIPTGASVSVSGQLVTMVADIGQQTATASRALDQQDAVLTSVQDRRDSISGVSMDEEVAALVQLQANFQANARIISTVNQLLDDLLNAF